MEGKRLHAEMPHITLSITHLSFLIPSILPCPHLSAYGYTRQEWQTKEIHSKFNLTNVFKCGRATSKRKHCHPPTPLHVGSVTQTNQLRVRLCNFHLDDQTLGGSTSGGGNFQTQAETLAFTTARRGTDLRDPGVTTGPPAPLPAPGGVAVPGVGVGGAPPAQAPVPPSNPTKTLQAPRDEEPHGYRGLGERTAPRRAGSRSKASPQPQEHPGVQPHGCHKALGTEAPESPVPEAPQHARPRGKEPHRCPTAAGQGAPRGAPRRRPRALPARPPPRHRGTADSPGPAPPPPPTTNRTPRLKRN